jgi:hypothetical protein
MDSNSKIVHNVTKILRVAIEDRQVSKRKDTNGSGAPYFTVNHLPDCRTNDILSCADF